MLECVDCDLCGANDTTHFFNDNSYDLVRCRQCGLLYVNPRPDEEELSAIYSRLLTDPEHGCFRDYLDHAEGLTAEGKLMVGKIEKYEKRGRLLDIGCAAGFFLQAASGRGWETHGIEPLDYFASFGRGELGLDILTGQLKDNSFPDGFFDVVTMFDVLSHFRSPRSDLREANRLLKDDGLLVVQTGNKGGLRTKEEGESHGESWAIPEHLYHFSPETLRLLFEKTDFDELRTIEVPVVSGKMAARLSAKSEQIRTHRLLGALFRRYKRHLRKPYQHLRDAQHWLLGRLYRHRNVSKAVLVFARKSH